MTSNYSPSLATPPSASISADWVDTGLVDSSGTDNVENGSTSYTSAESNNVVLADQNVRYEVESNKTREKALRSSIQPSQKRKVRKQRQKKYVATSFAEVREQYENKRQERLQLVQQAEHEQQQQQRRRQQQEWQWLNEQQLQQEHWQPTMHLDDSNQMVPFASPAYYEIHNIALAFPEVSFESPSNTATDPLLYSQQSFHHGQQYPDIHNLADHHQSNAVTDAARDGLNTGDYDPALFLDYQHSENLAGMGFQVQLPQTNFQGPLLADGNTGSAFDDLFQSEELRDFTFDVQLPFTDFTIFDNDQDFTHTDDLVYNNQFNM